MKQTLTQTEVEWLRCLSSSRKLIPLLPEEVQRKFESARLVKMFLGRPILTENGCQVLRQR